MAAARVAAGIHLRESDAGGRLERIGDTPSERVSAADDDRHPPSHSHRNGDGSADGDSGAHSHPHTARP